MQHLYRLLIGQQSESYRVPSAPTNGVFHEALFSGTDIGWHTRQKRLLNPLFSTSNVIRYEPTIDENIELLLRELRVRFVTPAKHGIAFDAVSWFAYFSLDTVVQMTFGARFGFLVQGKDVDSYLETLHTVETFWVYVRGLFNGGSSAKRIYSSHGCRCLTN